MADFEPPEDLGNQGVPDDGARQNGSGEPFRDTFFGPRDKKYLDFIAQRTTKIRGAYCYYYVLTSQTERTDDIVPVSKNRLVGPIDNMPANVRHAGGERPSMLVDAKGISAMYGEPVVIGHRLSSTEREVTKSWLFQEPVKVRGILSDPERAEQPDPRGSIYTQRIRLWLARVLCEETWEFRPRIGDMVRVPMLTNPPRTQDDYYDVEEVVLNNTRFGATGFFTAYTLQLARSSRHAPDRKLPEKDLRDAPDPPV